MDIKRIVRHLSMTPWHLERVFPASARAAIERAISAGEAGHGGEVRFAVEGALPILALLKGQTARERAIEVFSSLRIWDTENNNGVLIYLLLADRDVEIVADRGIDARVGAEAWERICRRMEAAFREGKFETGVVLGIEEVSRLLGMYFLPGSSPEDEMPDRPVVL